MKRDTIPCGAPAFPLMPPAFPPCHDLTPRSLSFVVPGEPLPKARARTVTTPSGKTRTYTPDTTAAYEQLVKVHAMRARNLAGWPKPTKADRFALDIEFRVGTGRHKDIDNMVKSVSDALQPHIILDDWQICRMTVERVMRCASPCTGIILSRVEERHEIL